MTMSKEFVRTKEELSIGKIEKTLAGVSVLLVAGAIFFPESGFVLPGLAALTALVDLSILEKHITYPESFK
jgi:hypothetical protein